jgi:SAM-dependent methyltransferase
MTEPDYFAIRKYRKEVPEKFLGYPLVIDRDGVLCRRLAGARRLLEVGAGDRPFEPNLRAAGFRGTLKTMDVNRTEVFDYYSLEEITETFDAVLMREVVEHMARPLLFQYLEKIAEILEPGGVLAITTPNPWAVSWVFADYTHISPWPPADLYGVLRWYGFKPVEIFRVIWPSRALWLKRLYWAIHSRFYDIDFAGGYIAFATAGAAGVILHWCLIDSVGMRSRPSWWFGSSTKPTRRGAREIRAPRRAVKIRWTTYCRRARLRDTNPTPSSPNPRSKADAGSGTALRLTLPVLVPPVWMM